MPLKFSISWYMEIGGTIIITWVWLEFLFFFFHFYANYWFFSSGIQKYFYYLPEGLICEPLIGVSTLWMDEDLVIIFSYAFQGRKICWKLDVSYFPFFSMFMLIFHIM